MNGYDPKDMTNVEVTSEELDELNKLLDNSEPNEKLKQAFKRSSFSVTLEEAFEIGRLEGLRESLTETLAICDSTDASFIRKYVEARLQTLNNNAISKRALRGKNES